MGLESGIDARVAHVGIGVCAIEEAWEAEAQRCYSVRRTMSALQPMMVLYFAADGSHTFDPSGLGEGMPLRLHIGDEWA